MFLSPLTLYRFAGFCLYPLARLTAPLFASFPGRTGWHFAERLGCYDIKNTKKMPAPGKPVIWLHAASVGEMQAALVLLAGLLAQGFGQHYQFVLTTTTKQGFALAESRLGDAEALVLMAPLDAPQAVARAIKLIRPALYICLETELWPLLLTTLAAHGTPLLLLNGRISEHSFRGYRKIRATMAAVLQTFSKMALIGAADGERFAALGADPTRMVVTGNLKFDASFDEDPAAVRTDFRKRLGLRENDLLLLCGSTHGGEEALLLDAWQELAQGEHGPDGPRPLRLALAPRHLERLHEVKRLLHERGLAFASYSEFFGNAVPASAQILLVDVMGELARLYAAGDLLFCGGSLLPRLSGHNVMEAARWGKPVFFGPHMRDWRDAANLLIAAGGGFQVADTAAFLAQVRIFLRDASAYATACHNARDCAAAQRGALARQLAVVAEFL